MTSAAVFPQLFYAYCRIESAILILEELIVITVKDLASLITAPILLEPIHASRKKDKEFFFLT